MKPESVANVKIVIPYLVYGVNIMQQTITTTDMHDQLAMQHCPLRTLEIYIQLHAFI